MASRRMARRHRSRAIAAALKSNEERSAHRSSTPRILSCLCSPADKGYIVDFLGVSRTLRSRLHRAAST